MDLGHITWVDTRNGNMEAYYTKLDNNGNTLVDDTRLTYASGTSSATGTRVDSAGNIHIVLLTTRDGNFEIYYTKLDNNGNTLVDDTRLTSNDTWSYYAKLVVDDSGNVHIAWSDEMDGNLEIYYTKGKIIDSYNELTAVSGDCDDNDPAKNPDELEVCNGIDDNCDGQIDEGFSLGTFYRDADNDGYGNQADTIQACSAPSGYVIDSTDCNDSNAAANPGGTETCNSIDDNCDGTVDEGTKTTFYHDSDGDTYGDPLDSFDACSAPAGYVSDNTDCDDTNTEINPYTVWYKDADGDLYSDGDLQVQCTQPAGHYLASDLTATGGDCDDTPATGPGVNPGATEICDNGIDENCNPADDTCQLGISNVSVVPSGQVTIGTDVSITTTPENAGGQTYYKVFVKGIQTLGQWFELTNGWSTNPNIIFDSSCFTPGLYSVSVFVSDEVSPYNESATDSRGERDAHHDSINVIELVGGAASQSIMSADDDCADIVDAPVAYWALDEGSGKTTLDATVNANDVTIEGTTWTTGKSGNALNFDGVDDYLSAPHSESLDITGAITIEAWIFMESSGFYPTIISKAGNNWGYLLEFANNTRKINLYLDGPNRSWSNTANTAVPLNQWTHIVATYDGVDTLKYYYNGNPDGTYTVSGGNIASNAADLHIGRRKLREGHLFYGSIDEAVIYNKALSATEVINRYSGGNPDTTPPAFSGVSTATDAQTDGAVDLSWSAASDPSTPITYNIYYATTSGGQDFSSPDATTQSTSYQVTGLTNDQTCYFVVKAEDAHQNEEQNTVELSTTPTTTSGGILEDAVAYWKFDDGSGSVASDEIGGNAGTITSASWTTGKYGSGLNFDGTGDYVDMGNVLNPGTTI